MPVVKNTWGKETQLIEYYSEEEDPNIPTIDLGVPNTESGKWFPVWQCIVIVVYVAVYNSSASVGIFRTSCTQSAEK